MILEAQRKWPLAAKKFGWAFRYQYVMSEAALDIPQFQENPLGNWQLYTGNGLPVVELADSEECPAGYMLGIGVGSEGLIDGAMNRLPMSVRNKDFWALFEKWLVEVAGRYAFVITALGETRLYCDPVGMIGVVYNKSDRLVAASPLLAIKDDLVPNKKYDFDVIRDLGGKVTLFHTIDERVTRLNPNCYLSLTDFTEHRHWPKDETFDVADDQSLDYYDEIFRRAAENIAEISRAFPVSLPVSGGQDSRLLLSFAEDHATQIDQFYTHVNNYATRRDAAIAGELCKALELPHEIHDWRNGTGLKRWQRKEFRQFWAMAFGTETPLPMEYRNGVILNVPEGNVVLRGHQTDLLRAVFVFKPKQHWRDAAWQLRRLLIVPMEDFSQDIIDRFSEDFFDWQNSLPENAMNKAADFMFLEIYYNATIGAAFPALWRNFYMSPFNSRRLIELSLSFSESARRSSHPVLDLIERYHPELSRIPFDYELSSDLSNVGDAKHYHDVTNERVKETLERLASLEGAAS